MLTATSELVVRELRVRWRGTMLVGLLIATLSAAAVAAELLGRAREHAIALRLDAMGPALSIVPPGVTAGALSRLELGNAGLPSGIVESVVAVAGSGVRAVEPRRIRWTEVEGARTPTIAIARWPSNVPDDGVLLGAELARRVRAESILLEGTPTPVRGVRPPLGDVEDVAVMLPLHRVARGERGGANELQLFLRAGTSAVDVQQRLQSSGLPITVIRHDLGEVAGHLLQDSLVQHRAGAYWIMALVAGVCLLVASHLDAAERSVEIATMVAIGAPRGVIVAAIAGRSAALAVAGGILGIAAGVAAVVLHDPQLLGHATLLSWDVPASMLSGAIVLAVVAAAPTAMAAAMRDPIPSLQDG